MVSIIQNKLKLNQKYYLHNDTQIYYAKNYCGGNILNHLYLWIPFEIIDKLFIILEDVYRNFYYKKHVIENFKKLKIDMGSLNTFYSKFIKLVVKFKFIKEILL